MVMNSIFKLYDKSYLETFISKRSGETKFGEVVGTIKELNDLKNTPAKYVLFGIPEDIGVCANYGVPGTSTAWKACLASLLNVQANHYTNPSNTIILGEVNCEEEMQKAAQLNSEMPNYLHQLGELVKQIDTKVSTLVETLISFGKIPVIVGGGHNNSYGNIKGSALAFKHPINAINFDVHTDFRALEHRHSGNGFSYAYHEGFLKKYYMFGIHKNYTSQAILEEINKDKQHLHFLLFEKIKLEGKLSFEEALTEAENFVDETRFGLEIDLDAIQDIPSSAMTPSGFSVNNARQFVSHFSQNNNVCYMHLCEASPGKDEKQTGKLLAYLITDFIQ